MGGARCSYRSCTIRSDKKTHMFHFPVFDKVRCHQWITNAQRLNFLDLKLSQLKNRVICEHHFIDDAFMNITKGKLKNSAVPTEDGPYCVTVASEKDEREIPINVDDIENDYLTNMEKKAHFSVKYGDFLTNDVTEPITLISDYEKSKLQPKKNIFEVSRKKYNLRKAQNDLTQDVKSINVDMKPNNIADNGNTAVADSLYQNVLLPNPKVVSIEYEELNLTEPNNKLCETPVVIPPRDSESCVFQSHRVKSSALIPINKQVKIISEKKISEPLKLIKGELQPISPSMFIKLPDKKKRQNVEMDNLENKQETVTLYFDAPNPQQVDDIQGFHNYNNLSSQHTDRDQMCLNEYNQQQIQALNNAEVQNINLQQENHYNMQLKQELEVLRMGHIQSISTVPAEFVSTSTNALNVFMLPNVQEVPTLPTYVQDPNYIQNISPPMSGVQNSSMVSTETTSCLSKNAIVSDESNNLQNVSEMSKDTQYIAPNKKMVTIPSSQSPIKSQLKSKMPPEKLAAIEQKRKFNMKLRDIIDSCLNKSDEEPDAKKLSAAMKRKLEEEKVGDHLSKHPDLPSKQENNIAYFEARLQRMEDTLLNKIEQNSQKITNLKRLIKPTSGKKTAFTQTYLSAEATKRQLYQQMSPYLSPGANSIIYEELFINKHVQKTITDNSPKKRKRR